MRTPEPPLDDPISKEPMWDEALERAQAQGYEGEDIDEAADWLAGRAEDEAHDSHADAVIARLFNDDVRQALATDW